jgi:hypothetical protein
LDTILQLSHFAAGIIYPDYLQPSGVLVLKEQHCIASLGMPRERPPLVLVQSVCWCSRCGLSLQFLWNG